MFPTGQDESRNESLGGLGLQMRIYEVQTMRESKYLCSQMERGMVTCVCACLCCVCVRLYSTLHLFLSENLEYELVW